MHKEMSVIEQLKAAGHRITLARRHIAEVLEANTRPLSAQDVHALLKRRGVESNRTTSSPRLRHSPRSKRPAVWY